MPKKIVGDKGAGAPQPFLAFRAVFDRKKAIIFIIPRQFGGIKFRMD